MGQLTRSSAAEKLEIIRLVEGSSLSVKPILAEVDIARSTFYRWYERYLEAGYDGLLDRQPQRFPLKRRIIFSSLVCHFYCSLSSSITDIRFLHYSGASSVGAGHRCLCPALQPPALP